MATATLRINVEGGADLARAFGQVQGVTRRARAAVDADERRSAAESARQEREKSKTAAREAQARVRAEKRAQQESARAQKEATRLAATESKKRLKHEEAEAKEIEKLAKASLAAKTNAQRKASAIALQESQKRINAAKREMLEKTGESSQGTNRRSSAVGMAQRIASEAIDRAAQLHGERQDARGRRANIQHDLNSSLFQAGADAASASSLRTMVTDFAKQEGISSETVTSALSAAQTEFSVLSRTDEQKNRGMSVQDAMRENMTAFLNNTRLAANTYQDPGQVARTAGMLAQTGMNGDQQRMTLLTLTGLANRGAIELGGVTRTALQPIQGRMAQAVARLGPGATEAQKQEAQRQAIVQTMAEMEVGRSIGFSPRELGNASVRMNDALTSDVTQQKMLTNLRHDGARGQAAIAKLFQNGHLRSQYQSMMGLAGGLSEIYGTDTTAVQNVFAGGGHGNAMSLQANWRRALGAMMGSGETVRAFMSGDGRDFTEEDVNRGAAMRRGEEQTQLTKDSEAKDSALAANTNALTQFSDRLASWMAAHPAESTMLGGEKGAAAALIAQDTAGAVGGFAQNTSNSMSSRLAQNSASHGGGAIGNIMAAMNPFTLVAAIKDAVMSGSREGIQNAQITATVDPHAASQAAGGAASERAQ